MVRSDHFTGPPFKLTLAEGKELLGELARRMLRTQMEEFVTCYYVASAGWSLSLGLIGQLEVVRTHK